MKFTAVGDTSIQRVLTAYDGIDKVRGLLCAVSSYFRQLNVCAF